MVTAPLAFWLPPWQLQDWQRTSAMQFRLPGNLGPRRTGRRSARFVRFASGCGLSACLGTARFASDSECPLISEQSGCSAGVYEHDILVLPAAIADECNQASKTLARIDRIEWKSFQPPGETDGFNRCGMRNAVCWACVPGYNVNASLIERYAQSLCREARVADDVGSNSLWFSINVYADNARVRHGERGTNHKTGLRSRATAGVNNGCRCETLRCGLGRYLDDRRRIADRAKVIRNPVGHKVRLAPRAFERTNELANRCVAIACPGDVMKVSAEQSIEECVARALVLRCGRLQTAVVNGKMTFHPELGCGGRDLTLAIRLNDATRHNCIGARCDSLS
jgi:hypothetical protein